jgi:heme/copper-type cytochrome/quinol oxidase subunit 2
MVASGPLTRFTKSKEKKMKKRYLPLFLVAALMLAALPVLAAEKGAPMVTDPKVKDVIIKVELEKAGLEPANITVYEGQKVTFELVAKDVEHGFKIAEFNINKTVKSGKVETASFDANKVGTFPITSSLAADKNLKGELKIVKK